MDLQNFLDEIEDDGNVMVIHTMDMFKDMDLVLKPSSITEQILFVEKIIIDHDNKRIIMIPE